MEGCVFFGIFISRKFLDVDVGVSCWKVRVVCIRVVRVEGILGFLKVFVMGILRWWF